MSIYIRIVFLVLTIWSFPIKIIANPWHSDIIHHLELCIRMRIYLLLKPD